MLVLRPGADAVTRAERQRRKARLRLKRIVRLARQHGIDHARAAGLVDGPLGAKALALGDHLAGMWAK